MIVKYLLFCAPSDLLEHLLRMYSASLTQFFPLVVIRHYETLVILSTAFLHQQRECLLWKRGGFAERARNLFQILSPLNNVLV